MNGSDRVVVLNQGAVIAEGEPQAVRNDPTVQEAYLGGYEAGSLDAASEPTTEDAGTDSEEGTA